MRACEKGEEGYRGQSLGIALVITLGVWHKVPCKKVEFRQPEGAFLLPQRYCFWGRGGQRTEVRG